MALWLDPRSFVLIGFFSELTAKNFLWLTYELQRSFNGHLGKSCSRFISDALINKTPNIASEIEFIDDFDIQRFIKKQKGKVRLINSYLTKGDALELSLPEKSPPDNGSYIVSSDQIGVLAASISSEILGLKEAALVGSDVERLKSIALKLTSFDKRFEEDAQYLMRLASKVAPEAVSGGKVING